MVGPQQAFARVRVAEVVAALSLATDLGMGQAMEFALRTCLVATRLAEAIGTSRADLRTTYYVALLRSAGCTAESPLEANIFGDEIAARVWLSALDFGQPAEMLGALVSHVGEGQVPARRVRMLGNALASLPRLPGIESAHCEVARHMARYLGLGEDIQRGVAEVFERWDGRGLPQHLKGDRIASAARVVAVAFDAVLFEGLGGVEGAIAVVNQRAGGKYDPAIADTFCRNAADVLEASTTESPWDAVLAAEPEPVGWFPPDQFEMAVRALGEFVDLLSPHLAGHSAGVAELAARAAKTCGLPAADCKEVRLAGFVHDIGRAGISAGIWNKPARLSDAERERVRLHTYYAERVLARAAGLSSLAALAGAHHERLDGSGYHRGAGAAALSITARLLAAADMYHAMGEPRPYRPMLAPDAAAAELRAAARAGTLDGQAVDAILDAVAGGAQTQRRTWPAGLSDREVEVLRLVARGMSNRQVGDMLSISPRTAGNHIQHIYDKIGVSTRAGATLFAMRHDLMGSMEDRDFQK